MERRRRRLQHWWYVGTRSLGSTSLLARLAREIEVMMQLLLSEVVSTWRVVCGTVASRLREEGSGWCKLNDGGGLMLGVSGTG